MRFPKAWILGRSLPELALSASLPLILVGLLLIRPPTAYYALPLAPIALAAVLYEFAGGTLVALAAMAGVGLLIALDPEAARRATTLQQAWPILSMYPVIGSAVGWLATYHCQQERSLLATARQLQAVTEIAQAITTSLDLDQTVQTIMAETRRLVPFTRAAAMLREGENLRVVATETKTDHATLFIGRIFSIKDSAAGKAIRSGRRWKGRPQDIPFFPDTQALCKPGESCLILPLKLQKKAIGAFLLGARGIDDDDQSKLDSLDYIAQYMAIALEHARLFTAQQRWAGQISAISEASQEIAAALDLDRTLRLVMAKAAETLPMDAGALFRLDPERQAYRIAVSHNLSPDHVAQIKFDFEEGVPGWVVAHRQPLIISGAGGDERVHPNVVQEGILSVLAVPLIAREKIVGVLNLYSKSSTQAFDRQALRLAQVFAAQAAYAIENAGLVNDLRQAATELEERVARRTRQLQESQEKVLLAEKLAVVGRLAASVAHEVNNPLQAITLQLQLIEAESLDPGPVERLHIVQEELARISGIIQRLLEFQRPKPGTRQPCDMIPLLRDVLALAGKQLQNEQVRVDLVVPEQLPQVLAAGDQLKQVFLNLILNAVEAMPHGGDLRIQAGTSGNQVVINFEDNGIGMPPEVLHQLFEPFFSTKTGGSGLGLTVSQEILSQHQGQLEACSQVGAGSTFRVILPAYIPESARSPVG